MFGILLGLAMALVMISAFFCCLGKMFNQQMRHERERCKKLAEKKEIEKLTIMGVKE